jgi:hypothetical protein
MEYLAVLIMPVVFGLIIFFVYKQYTGKNLAQKTDAMADNIIGITSHGFARNVHGFRGTFRGYDVNVYPSSTPGVGYMQGKLFQVWISIAPFEGQLKGLGGFFGKYMVVGERPGYAMIGFTLRYDSGTDQSSELINLINKLVDDLQAKGVMTYVA